MNTTRPPLLDLFLEVSNLRRHFLHHLLHLTILLLQLVPHLLLLLGGPSHLGIERLRGVLDVGVDQGLGDGAGMGGLGAPLVHLGHVIIDGGLDRLLALCQRRAALLDIFFYLAEPGVGLLAAFMLGLWKTGINVSK